MNTKGLVKHFSCILSSLECKEKDYYSFIDEELRSYVDYLKNQKIDDLEDVICKAAILKKPTKRVLQNLIQQINKICLEILRLQYKGDILGSSKLLERLLIKSTYTKGKLNDLYANMLKLNLKENKKFYRCVDFKRKETPDCKHVPFQLRHKVYQGRYNMTGFPCLYISDNLKTISLELGDVKEGKQRWYSCISLKKGKSLFVMDFSIPTDENVDSMTEYDLISFLVNYPLMVLCNVKNSHKDSVFSEQYMFSQLFMHILLLSKNDSMPRFHGIKYSSMYDKSTCNYIFPATYTGEKPQVEGYSQNISDMFDFSEPQKYEKNN